ncbi:MAG: diguanylate cyclase [Gammaproteobacteria bacterium]|nr:diguanylate cyclase [Gammaproteobacteria bacterium]
MDTPKSTPPTTITAAKPGDYAIRVLLVDDQAMIGEAIRRALADQPNIEFRYCANSADAVAAAEQMKPTVILQDLVMPGVDGLVLVQQYRANPATQETPIIVLSTKEEPAIKSEAFTLGANDYLIKIPDKVELIARVRYHSKAYSNLLQRDQAFQALAESQQRLMELNIELQRLSTVDGLTGLSNRRYFNEYVEREWKRSAREQHSLSILMIDVDDFKKYNDTYGHLAGDEVLKSVSTIVCQSAVRPADLAARFGGEEFVVVLPVTPMAGALHVGEKLCRGVEALKLPHSASTVGACVSISIGGASTVPQRGDVNFLRLIEVADQALYDAKRAGKNRVVVAEQGRAAT